MVFLLLQLEFDLLTILKYFHIIMLQNFELLTFPFFFCFLFIYFEYRYKDLPCFTHYRFLKKKEPSIVQFLLHFSPNFFFFEMGYALFWNYYTQFAIFSCF